MEKEIEPNEFNRRDPKNPDYSMFTFDFYIKPEEGYGFSMRRNFKDNSWEVFKRGGSQEPPKILALFKFENIDDAVDFANREQLKDLGKDRFHPDSVDHGFTSFKQEAAYKLGRANVVQSATGERLSDKEEEEFFNKYLKKFPKKKNDMDE